MSQPAEDRAPGFWPGLRAGIPVLLGVAPFGFMFGAAAIEAGLAPAQVLGMSLTVFAGASQFAAVSLWASPLPVAAIISTAALLNLRYLLMGVSLRPLLLPLGGWRASLAMLFVTDESWAVTLDAMRKGAVRPAFLLGIALPLYLIWATVTALGVFLGRQVAEPARWGLDYILAASFLTLIVARWKGPRSLPPWAVAAAAAFAVRACVPGLWYVVAGALAGAAAAALQWRPEAP